MPVRAALMAPAAQASLTASNGLFSI